MSLINELRQKRDSWLHRFEEHRKGGEDDEFVPIDRERENERVERARKMVGVFPKKEDYNKRWAR